MGKLHSAGLTSNNCRDSIKIIDQINEQDLKEFLSITKSKKSRRIALHIKPEAERPLRSGHPWLFEESITKQNRQGEEGDVAVIFDRKNRFLAVGLYDPHSVIRVRVLQHNSQELIDQDWFERRMAAAIKVRDGLEGQMTTGYRLVNGENDGFPGLIIDRYEQTAVIKLYSAAWIPHLTTVVGALLSSFAAERIILRLSRAVAGLGSDFIKYGNGQVLHGSALEGRIRFQENGLWFEADLLQGHKTGFYLDQRENRARVEKLIAKRGGVERVLDVFAYTGAFSLYAARGGAREVISVDVSQPALEMARRAFDMNQKDANAAAAIHTLVVDDAFDQLAGLADKGAAFDAVLVDPPSFANKGSQVEGALAAYGRLVKLALQVLRPGGLLVMSSCSSRVSADRFFDRVVFQARISGRSLEEIARTGHAIDHPVTFPEGAYLKCLFAVVD